MKTIKQDYRLIWVGLVLFLMTCPLFGQVKKTKELTQEDYHLWSTLNAETISDHGKWVSYTLAYESGLDTLFVKSTISKKAIAFPKGNNGKFIGDSWFGCQIADAKFRLVELNSGKVQDFEKVQEFFFSENGRHVVLITSGTSDKNSIVVRDLKGEIEESIDNVIRYTTSPLNKAIAYSTLNESGGGVGIIQLGLQLNKTAVVTSNSKQYENIVWQRTGQSIVFVGRDITAAAFSSDRVLYYRMDSKHLFEYDTTTAASWPKDMELYGNYAFSLGISDDGERVFFMNKSRSNFKPKAANDVQVWNAADKELYTLYNRFGSPEYYPRVVMWLPDSGKLVPVGDVEHSSAKLLGNQRYALVFDTDANKPSFKQEPDRDFYLLDLATGMKEPFLMQQPGTEGNLFLSPEGKYIVYFRQGQWWVYTLATHEHKAITKAEDTSFCSYNNKSAVIPDSYGYPDWTKDDQSIYLYDEYDLWEYTFSTSQFTRLTHGRERQIVYSIVKGKADNADSVVFKVNAIDRNAPLLLRGIALNHSQWGYFIWNRNQPLQTLVSLAKKVHSMHKAAQSSSFMFVKEDFNEPPSLEVVINSKPPQSVFRSNPQHYHYGWGRSTLINYSNSKGEALQGVMYYPFDYDPKKQYPMLVNVYQKLTTELHRYVNPSLMNGSDFNISYFTSKGYFVLQPDIVYEYGNPGFSATDCVVAATLKAVEAASIDKKRLGLIGHSFGGYETNFIITQTDLFAAAVGSAGLTDFTSHYLSEYEGGKPNIWRFENQQMRMKVSLFEDYKGYWNNSVISHVSNIRTPLFTYTGMKDNNVPANQSYELYHAMRRLHKEHIFLVYPNETHNLIQPEHQLDISKRLTEWFGYYLKGEARPDWFNPK